MSHMSRLESITARLPEAEAVVATDALIAPKALARRVLAEGALL